MAEVLEGDALALPLPDASVDAIATDPPYSLEFLGEDWTAWAPDSPRYRTGWETVQQSHGVGEQERGAPVSYTQRRRTFECSACGRRDGFRDANDHGCTRPAPWEVVWTDPRPLESEALAAWHGAWLAEALRVIRPGGFLAAFTAPRFLGELDQAAKHAGWDVCDVGVWIYSGSSPGYSPLRNLWNPFLLARKLGPTATRRRARYDDGEWIANAIQTDGPLIAAVPRLHGSSTERLKTAQGSHPTQKPVQLMRWVVGVVSEPGDLVLDPFCGSGSTLVAAELEGRRALGVEIDPEYVALARRRTSEGQEAPTAHIPQGRLL